MKIFNVIFALSLSALPAVALAEESAAAFGSKETVCKQDSRQRKVKLAFKDETSGSDCKVSYVKETDEPNAEKVLWSAQKEPTFCKEKAEAFVEKLKGMGWACE